MSFLKEPSKRSDIIPLVVACIAICAIILMPMKIMGLGFLPLDDALRHVAKAMSGKDWNDILVLRDRMAVDTHPGYHALLGFIYHITKFSPDALLTFSVIILFIIFCLAPVPFTGRPEAWLTALFAISLTSFPFIMRLLFGRPYIITMTTLVILCFLWPKLKKDRLPYPAMILITALIALATWTHNIWYMFIFIILSFALAREWRATSRLSACVLIGILSGAILTGHPWQFITQNLTHLFLAFNKQPLPRTFVMEFKPFAGDFLAVMTVALLLCWRYARKDWDTRRIDNPVFILAALGWIMGFYAARFWLDWGLPALLVWMTQEFNDIYGRYISLFSARRVLLTFTIAALLYANVTRDTDNRWSERPAAEYMYQKNPEISSWMPDPGGIIYSDDLRVFYVTFFKNPYAPWRYMVGFEPGLMPQKDLEIFLGIQLANGAPRSFLPWIKKMRPEDRLIITPDPGTSPAIHELEWYYAGSGLWIGRLPRPARTNP